MKKLELLAPVGDKERLEAAVYFGADAVYFAGKKFGLRALASNFDENEIKEAVEFCHEHNVKVYITVNILAHNADFTGMVDYLKYLDSVHVDGVIVSDLGIAHLVKEYTNLELHVSTQANITNKESAKIWVKLGAKRLVLARELNVQEIKEIKEAVGENIDIECFCHGAMCISYSGRCLLSNYFVGRDSNRGACAQPCRWNYALYSKNEQNPIDEYFPVEEDARGTYILNSKDMCLIEHIKELSEAGIVSFKIEGRMKSIHYVATIVSAYRRLIDEYYKNKAISKARLNYYKNEIKKAENRITSTGFLNERMVHQGLLLNTGVENPTQSFIGLILSPKDKDGYYLMEVRNYFEENDYVEAFTNNGKTIAFHIKNMLDEDNNKVVIARHPKQILRVKIKYNLPIDTLIRKK